MDIFNSRTIYHAMLYILRVCNLSQIQNIPLTFPHQKYPTKISHTATITDIINAHPHYQETT